MALDGVYRRAFTPELQASGIQLTQRESKHSGAADQADHSDAAVFHGYVAYSPSAPQASLQVQQAADGLSDALAPAQRNANSNAVNDSKSDHYQMAIAIRRQEREPDAEMPTLTPHIVSALVAADHMYTRRTNWLSNVVGLSGGALAGFAIANAVGPQEPAEDAPREFAQSFLGTLGGGGVGLILSYGIAELLSRCLGTRREQLDNNIRIAVAQWNGGGPIEAQLIDLNIPKAVAQIVTSYSDVGMREILRAADPLLRERIPEREPTTIEAIVDDPA